MTPNKYQTLALSSEADQERIRQRIYAEGLTATRLENAARGLSDEAGELSGAVKRWLEYGQPLDRTNVIEECGDVLWRVAQALRAVGATLEEAMEANLRKLSIRYKTGTLTEYEAAEHNRDRMAEAKAMEYEQSDQCTCCDRAYPITEEHEPTCPKSKKSSHAKTEAIDPSRDNPLGEVLQESSEWIQDGHGFGHQKES